MKKLLALSLAILLLFLTGCQANKLHDVEYEVSSSSSLEIKTEKEVYSKEDTVIRYSITNISDSEASINSDKACFTLHKLVGDEWKWVETKIEHYWTSLALIMPSGAYEMREINLEEYFNLPLDEGTYRICIETDVSNTFEVK